MPILLRRLISDLISRRPGKAFDLDDPRLAVAALMFHVISVDGRVTPHEVNRWEEELARRFSLTIEEARALAEAGRAAELETADPASFTGRLQRGLTRAERHDVVRALWALVLVDGAVQEFEDNAVWRIADLLGIEARDRVMLRKEVETEHEAAALGTAEDDR
ncbi:MAG: TerB family tellurite resistance protein [Siculibacillus sp.]|nr:TerB family tellurite resistance protein [Siculibacillus sp.]